MEAAELGELIGKYANKFHELTGPTWERVKRAASKEKLLALRTMVEAIRPIIPKDSTTSEERTAMLAGIEATKSNVTDMIDSMLADPEPELEDDEPPV